ncbi:MAG TPA: DUF3147 family protein [Alphaproteobacteria bacterium]|nr:DUF3147 family protein [Alphaproteobacteria bacterium]
MPGGIKLNLSALSETGWHEYVIRFGLGGLATVVAGAVAKLGGPEVGGLFLALPAIFCASATLIEKHERRRKARQGLTGARRGRDAAALDAAGAALGSVALAGFWRVDLAARAAARPGIAAPGVRRVVRRLGRIVVDAPTVAARKFAGSVKCHATCPTAARKAARSVGCPRQHGACR